MTDHAPKEPKVQCPPPSSSLGPGTASTACSVGDGVSIHPFADGNGRVSRLVMDHALASEGLPPALLRDPKIDYLVSPEAWADEVRTGVMTTYETAARHVGGFNSAVGARNPVAIATQWGAIVGLTSDPQATTEALYVNVCE